MLPALFRQALRPPFAAPLRAYSTPSGAPGDPAQLAALISSVSSRLSSSSASPSVGGMIPFQPPSSRSAGDRFSDAASRTPQRLWAEAHALNAARFEREKPLSLYAGRTIPLGRGEGTGPQAEAERAMRKLNGVLRRNDVRRELKLRERYEKPAQKRRRLKSERHRRRFAEFIRDKVRLVHELRARGEGVKH